MPRIPIALQLYSVRQDCAQDLPRTLEAVARMGYDGVEFAGYHGYSAQDLRRLTDDLGLRIAGTHAPLASLLGDALPETVAFNQVLGNRFLVVPWLPEEYRGSRADWLNAARMFNGIADRLAPHDMVTGYHNHFFEFTPLEGEQPWDTLFANTGPGVVMQIDTGNCVHGGGDPTPFVSRYPARALTVHLKEHKTSYNDAVIGEGDTDWQAFFQACESVGGTEWYIVEQELEGVAPLEVVRRCIDNLRGMGK
ncbi:MAG: sugar phosphate isomerase/epimerase family protein [Anaerolineae bacterium]